jgi:uncharacterized integral membrane protein (TIGR00698 family)
MVALIASRWILFFVVAVATLTAYLSPPIALALGLVLALGIGNPAPDASARWSRLLLQWSVVGLGFGLDLPAIWDAGRTGFTYTAATIVGTLVLGTLLGRWLRVEKAISQLVSSGTAICGGSAIAAVGGAIGADARAMSVSLATVFVLNAVALFVFPPLGQALGMSQEAFGLWSAIAIHDTSSVVGAAAKYGDKALAVATTVKLTRALWIIPLTLFFAWRSRQGNKTIRWPWFILFFVLAALLRTLWPEGEAAYGLIHGSAKRVLTLTLFLIGASLSRDALRRTGARPMLLGVVLWVIVGVSGLLAVQAFAPA